MFSSIGGVASLCLIPEVLDVVLHSAEVQSVGQGLVVGQSLGGWPPVHIWRGERMQAETHSAVRTCVYGSLCWAKGRPPMWCYRHWEGLVCVCSCMSNLVCTQVCVQSCKSSLVFEEVQRKCVGGWNNLTAQYHVAMHCIDDADLTWQSTCFSLLVTLG